MLSKVIILSILESEFSVPLNAMYNVNNVWFEYIYCNVYAFEINI